MRRRHSQTRWGAKNPSLNDHSRACILESRVEHPNRRLEVWRSQSPCVLRLRQPAWCLEANPQQQDHAPARDRHRLGPKLVRGWTDQPGLEGASDSELVSSSADCGFKPRWQQVARLDCRTTLSGSSGYSCAEIADGGDPYYFVTLPAILAASQAAASGGDAPSLARRFASRIRSTGMAPVNGRRASRKRLSFARLGETSMIAS